MITVLITAVLVLGVTQVLTAILNHDERKRLLNAVLAKHAAEFRYLETGNEHVKPGPAQEAEPQAPRRPMGL